MDSTDQTARFAGFVVAGVIGLILLSLIFGSFGIIGEGNRGVKTRTGRVVGVVEPGLYFKLPFIEGVREMSVKNTVVLYERENPLAAASKDLQDVQVATVVEYRVDATKVGDIYKQFGDTDTYEENVVRPAVRDTVKAVASQFTAEELVTKRQDFTSVVMNTLQQRLQDKHAIVVTVSITNFQFSESFTKAIEAKVTAEQDALAAQNRLEQVKFEAQQKVESAKAEAEAIRIQAQAITQQGGAEYVRMKTVEKWNGVGCNSYCGLEASTGLLISR